MSSSSSLPEADALLTEASEPILTESGEMLQIEASSSSSLTGNVFLDNIDLFRQYSLDTDLIELYFNKGVSAEFVDLDSTNSQDSSSSSSGAFSILIDLEGDEGIFGDPYIFPEELDFYFYDESADGSPAPGTFTANKVPGKNTVVVSFASSSTSGSDFQFQINIEHPDLFTIRNVLQFSERRTYSHSASTSYRIANSVARLEPSYITSLASWINDFWAAYDADPASPITEPPKPAANLNTEFDPFAHARWKIRSESAQIGIMEAPELEEGKGWMTVRGWNFLGVEGKVWDCITRKIDGLYQLYHPPSTPAVDIIMGKARQLEKSFDCRSFTAAAAYALKAQLSEECEVDISYLKVGQTGNFHALLFVKMKGCKKESNPCDCCSGSFMYEPQSGATFRSQDEYCKKEPKLCEDKSQWNDVPIEDAATNNFGNPDWENDATEMNRIKNVVCGCLTGDYPAGSAEAMIKGKCDTSAATFKSWFKSNFSWEPGRATSPMSDMPSILSCEKVVCEKGRDPAITGPLCTQKAEEGEQGITPYQCETQCQEKWECYEASPHGENSGTEGGDFECLAAYSLDGIIGTYDEKEMCLDVCNDDKVCVHEWNILYDCEAGQWTRENDGFSTPYCVARDRIPTPSTDWEEEGTDCWRKKFVFVEGSSCGDSESCPRIANGPGAPSEVGSFPSEPPADCCGSWCEIDSELELTGNCISGTLQDWIVKNTQSQALEFKLEPCDSEKCQECPPGYRTAAGSSQMLRSQSILCVPDCNISPNKCEEQFGSGYCCVENTILSNGTNLCVPCEGCCEPDPLSESQVCVDCPEKTKSLRFHD